MIFMKENNYQSDGLSACWACVHSLEPRGQTFYVEFVVAFELIPFASFKVLLLADGTLFD